MTATHTRNGSKVQVVLHLAFELGWTKWKLAFTTGLGQKPRLRQIKARDVRTLQEEIAEAKQHFGLSVDAPVVSCYEAGRDGFWLHRYLTAQHMENVIVDAASIEVNRRARRAKSDRLDAGKLVNMLVRYHQGDRKLWSVARVPSVDDEDRRQLHRELEELKDERTQHINRIKGLLASQGLELQTVNGSLVEQLAAFRLWDGTSLPPELQQRLVREFERWQFVQRQILDLENDQRRRILRDDTPHVELVRHLLGLRGVGRIGAWLLTYEVFGWRQFQNRRQVASLLGLTPTPYQSGDSDHEQGISKAGNRRLRRLLVELAWGWLRLQADTELSRWYWRRFGKGSKRQRKIGIVALARKLVIVLWKYVVRGEIPADAKLCDWRRKVNGRPALCAAG